MAVPFSRALGVTHEALTRAGAFDGFVDIDSRLYVDPHLLATCPLPEFRESRARFECYFGHVLTLLRQSRRRDDAMWREASRRLVFRELPSVPLGYSRGHTDGSAVGPGLALQLTDLAKQIVDAGIEDPEIFELVGLLQEGIGADRVSDMTVRVILPDLYAYSARVARDLGTRIAVVEHDGQRYRLPANVNTGRTVTLVPRSLLRHLPVAHSWDHVDRVSRHNAALRSRVNPIIGGTWKRATGRSVSKEMLRATLLHNPDLIRDLIGQYREKPAAPYNFDSDPAGQHIWYEVAQEVIRHDPLDLTRTLTGPSDVVNVVQAICLKFKTLVEDNRLSRVLFNDDATSRPERIAQLTFFGIAESYCEANNLDISPETDAGAGPVDFKFSRGFAARVLVEVKLSSNSRLKHGFERQLPTYGNAERSTHDILLVVQTTPTDKGILAIQRAAATARRTGQRVPEIIVIDGRLRPAASRAPS